MWEMTATLCIRRCKVDNDHAIPDIKGCTVDNSHTGIKEVLKKIKVGQQFPVAWTEEIDGESSVFSSGEHTNFYQLFIEKDEKLLLPTTQILVELSFLQGNVKLKEVGYSAVNAQTNEGNTFLDLGNR